MNKKLENEIELLPESPGVYLMYNVLNTIIYVGKAKNLRKRILNIVVFQRKYLKSVLTQP